MVAILIGLDCIGGFEGEGDSQGASERAPVAQLWLSPRTSCLRTPPRGSGGGQRCCSFRRATSARGGRNSNTVNIFISITRLDQTKLIAATKGITQLTNEANRATCCRRSRAARAPLVAAAVVANAVAVFVASVAQQQQVVAARGGGFRLAGPSSLLQRFRFE